MFKYDENRVSEAYEMLINPPKVTTTYQHTSQKTKTEVKETKEEAQKRAREEARKKAQAYAKMKRKEFMRTDAYKTDQAKIIILEQLYPVMVVFCLFIAPVVAFISWGAISLIPIGVLILTSWVHWVDFFRSDYQKFDIKLLLTSFKIASKSKGFQIGVMILFCIYVFFFIFPNTEFTIFQI